MKTSFFKFNIYLLLTILLYSNIIYAREDSIVPVHILSVTQGLQSPVRIAIDNQDIIYVTDAFRKCIVKYNNSGELMGTINPGGLPISIAINDENQIFIGDGETGVILKLDKSGTATEFYTEAVFPSSMIFSPDNLLYVVDSKRKQVIVIDLFGNVVRTIGDGTLILPTGIAYDHSNDRIYVSEHGGIGTGFNPVVKIWTFDLYGNLVGSLGSHGNKDGQFYRIQGLAVGRCGKIYATDPFQGTVSVFDEAGFITKFGEYGEEPGQLNAPMDIVSDSRGYIWITSMNSGSLEVYNINETNPLPIVNLGEDIDLCEGEIHTLDAGSSFISYLWSDGSTNQTLDVSISGNYSVTVGDSNGCENSDELGVTIIPLPVPEFTYTENHLEVSFLNTSRNADSYLWDFGDNETSEEINPVHLYKKSGKYNVVLTVSNERCGESTLNKTLNLFETSVESIEHENFVNIYPNPSTGTINIEFDNPVQSDLWIEITNIKGQKIYLKVFKTHKVMEQINLSSYPKGIYIIKIVSEGLILTDKIILNE